MAETWTIPTLAAVAAISGFAWLALAMEVHWHQVHGVATLTCTAQLALRALGVASLTVSALLCFMADRPSMAVLVWVMLLAAAVPLVALALAWRPRLLRAFWPWSRH
ncbi:MAG: DUF3325 family protein [Rubrivivax sp.]